jgi:hypothetical protein
MHADQLTNLAGRDHQNHQTFERFHVPTFPPSNLPSFPSSNLKSSIFNLQLTVFVPQTKPFVPQTTNQEKTAITSNYGGKQEFMINQNGPKIFDPRKRCFKFFLLKNQQSQILNPRRLPNALHRRTMESYPTPHPPTALRGHP